MRRRRKYSRRNSVSVRRSSIFLYIFLAFLLLAAIVTAAVITGNILQKKADEVNRHRLSYIEPEYPLYKKEQNVKHVDAQLYNFANDIDEFIDDGIHDLSITLRYSDGSLAYYSDIAEKTGLDDMDSGIDLEENIEYIHKKGGYVSGVFYLKSFISDDESLKNIYTAYETELILEAAESGVDEIMLIGIEPDKDNIDSVMSFLSGIRKKAENVKIGVKINYQSLFYHDTGDYIASRIMTCADILAIDAGSVPCKENFVDDTLEDFGNVVSSLYYYNEAYDLRYIFDIYHSDLYDLIEEYDNKQMIK